MTQVSNRDHLDTFNSGFMVVQPNMRTYSKMTALLNSYTSWFVDQVSRELRSSRWRRLGSGKGATTAAGDVLRVSTLKFKGGKSPEEGR